MCEACDNAHGPTDCDCDVCVERFEQWNNTEKDKLEMMKKDEIWYGHGGVRITDPAQIALLEGHSGDGCVGVSKLSDDLIAGYQFRRGDRVTKKTGSSWTGKVVGFYSTSLTPVGYAVESEREPGSVQIYPESALQAVPDKDGVTDVIEFGMWLTTRPQVIKVGGEETVYAMTEALQEFEAMKARK